MRHKPNVMERRIRLKTVNAHVTCSICKGYLIDATTITECLHTFCKSCLVKFLEENNTCPKCNIEIHRSYPLDYVSHDRTMQDIVFKLVPHLQNDERERVVKFYKSRGMEVPKETNGVESKSSAVVNGDVSTNHTTADKDKDYHRNDEQVNVYLECVVHNMKLLKRQYLRCSCHTTITHLKKFLAQKLYNNIERFKEIELLCNQEILGKDHTLKFVIVTRWRYKDIPLKISYRHKLQL